MMSFSKVFELILLYLLLQLPCAITSPIGANDPVQHHANHYPLRTGTPPAVVASTPPCHANSTSLSISLSTSVPIRVTTLQSATNLDPSAVATRHSLSVPTKTTGAYPSPSATAESPTELARFLVNCDSDDTAIERETWRDHQKLADAAKKFSPNSKWQEAANIYFGSESSEKKCSEPMQKIMNNHANLHTENHPQRHVAIWCREKGEHSDEPPWGLACRDDSPGYSIPMEHEDLGWIYNIVFCQQFYSDMLKLEAIEWQIDNGRIDKWDAVKMWQSRPLVYYHELSHFDITVKPNRTTDHVYGAQDVADYAKEHNCLSGWDKSNPNEWKWYSTLLNTDTWATFAMMVWVQDKYNLGIPPSPPGHSAKKQLGKGFNMFTLPPMSFSDLKGKKLPYNVTAEGLVDLKGEKPMR